MLYLIDGKYYILVSGYYKEVTIDKDRNGEYNVEPIKDANKTKIEASIVKNYTTIDVENAYNSFNTIRPKKSLNI